VPGGGTCTACAARDHALQRKLTIGARNDPLEIEADRLAEQALSSRRHVSPTRVSARAVLRRSATNLSPQTVPASVDRTLAGENRPLAPLLRRDMESRFGHDFSRVRVHTGALAEQSAHELHASAYTVGQHVVFGAGRFAPTSPSGRHLLAHELAHVVQQDGDSNATVQRQPADAGPDTPSDAGPGPAPASGTPTPGANVVVTPVVALPTRVPSNEAEAIEDTAKVFPTDEDVRAAIGTLPAVVQKEVGTDAAYQRKFLYRMSLYLGPHPKPIQHFTDIVEFTFADRTKLNLHRSAMTHFEAVQAALGKDNMPSTSGGFSLRDKIRGEVLTPGLMVHAVGYAIDFRAVGNPHIKDRRLVAVQALHMISASGFQMSTGPWATRRSTIKKMGRGELAEDAPERKAFIERFRAEGAKDFIGNVLITHALDAKALDTFRALRTEYKAMHLQKRAWEKRFKAAKRKLKRGETLEARPDEFAFALIMPDLATERGKLAAEPIVIERTRLSIVQRTRALLAKLVDKTDADIARHRAMPHVAESDKEYAANIVRLEAANAAAKRAVGASDRTLKRAKKVLDDNATAAERLDRAIAREADAAKRSKLEPRKTEAQSKQRAAVGSMVKAVSERGVAWQEAMQSGEELKAIKGARGARIWLHDLEQLQRGLSEAHFDARLVFGIGDKDAETDRSVRDPSLVQLYSKGYFNPDPVPAPTIGPVPPRSGASQGFDLPFMEEMAKHGFDQGSQWSPGGVDSMHFEFAEGVDALHSPTDAKRKVDRKL
jgi:Domain of unknown function (DUF4157)